MGRLKMSDIQVSVIDEKEHLFMAKYPDLSSPFADTVFEAVFMIRADNSAIVEVLNAVYDDDIEISVEDSEDLRRAEAIITRWLKKNGEPVLKNRVKEIVMGNYKIKLPDGRDLFETSNPYTAVRMLLTSRKVAEGTMIQCPESSYMRMLLERVASNSRILVSAACQSGYREDLAMADAIMRTAIAA